MPPTVALLPVTCRRYAASAGARVCRKMNHVIRDGTEVDVVVSECVTWHTLDGTLVRRPVSRTCVRPDGRSQAGEEDDHDDNRDIRMPLCHNPDPSRRFSSFRRHLSTCVRVPRGAARRTSVLSSAPRSERGEFREAPRVQYPLQLQLKLQQSGQSFVDIDVSTRDVCLSLTHTPSARRFSAAALSASHSLEIFRIRIYVCIWDVCGGRTDEGCRARRVKRCNPGAVQCARGGQAGGTLMVG